MPTEPTTVHSDGPPDTGTAVNEPAPRLLEGRRRPRRGVVLAVVLAGVAQAALLIALALALPAAIDHWTTRSAPTESAASKRTPEPVEIDERAADLPWDAALPVGHVPSTALIIGGDSSWIGGADRSEFGVDGYTNTATACSMWATSGGVGAAIEGAAGDRDASIRWTEQLLGAPLEAAGIIDASLAVETENGVGRTDVIAVPVERDAGVSTFALARVYSGAGKGVFVYAECPEASALHPTFESALRELGVIVGPAM